MIDNSNKNNPTTASNTSQNQNNLSKINDLNGSHSQNKTINNNNTNPNNNSNPNSNYNKKIKKYSEPENKQENENENKALNSTNITNQSITETQKTNIILRLSLIACAFAIWLLYRYSLRSSNNEKKWNFLYCFEDKLLSEIFLPITNYISQNLYIRDFLLITSSAFLDVFMICFICVYISKGNSWAPLLHMGLFYGLRGAVVQNLVIMQIYDTYIFEYPGFPSLVVPYFRAADFFYSGHSGCALLLGLQMADMGYAEMKYVGFLLGIFEGLVLTMLRIHYSIDIIFGIICGHYLYFVAKEVAKFADTIFPMGLAEQRKSINETKNFVCDNDHKDFKNKSDFDKGGRVDMNKIQEEEEHNTSFFDAVVKKGNENNKNYKDIDDGYLGFNEKVIGLDLKRMDSSRALKNNQIDEIIEGRRK